MTSKRRTKYMWRASGGPCLYHFFQNLQQLRLGFLSYASNLSTMGPNITICTKIFRNTIHNCSFTFIRQSGGMMVMYI